MYTAKFAGLPECVNASPTVMITLLRSRNSTSSATQRSSKGEKESRRQPVQHPSEFSAFVLLASTLPDLSMAALPASPNDGRARQCRSPTSHWPNQNQHIRQATFAKSGGTGCPHKSMVACHTPSTMPQTARTLNSKLELQSPGAATSSQIYRSVRVRLPTITRHDGAITVGDQNRRLGVQVIVEVYEKWLRGVAKLHGHALVH